MDIQQTTTIPEVNETIVMLREMSADEKIRQEAYYREKRLHDEATALGGARREGMAKGIEIGRAEGKSEGITEGIDKMIAGMRAAGFTEKQVEAVRKAMR